MKKKQKGFSLIELLIVVALILIIAAIAIPNLLCAKIAANQASAVQALRTMTSAEQTFSSMFADGYSLTLAQLGGPPGSTGCAKAGLIDEVLSTAPYQNAAISLYLPQMAAPRWPPVFPLHVGRLEIPDIQLVLALLLRWVRPEQRATPSMRQGSFASTRRAR